MPDIRYQRLTRTRTSSFFSVAAATRTSLWLGPDHLLCVDFNGFSESYKRFYFRDIQAIIIRETKRRRILNIILGTLLLILFICMVATYGSIGGSGPIVGWSIPMGIILIPFIINNLLGTTCLCQLRTAVQTEDLSSVSRISRAIKILDRIRPLIAEAQGGELTSDQVAAQMRERGWLSPSQPVGTSADDPGLPPRLAP